VTAEEGLPFLKLTNRNGGPIIIKLDTDLDPTIGAKTGLVSGTFLDSGSNLLTGTVTKSLVPDQENIAVGTDTKFTSEVRAGDTIIIRNIAYVVQSVRSDSELSVTEVLEDAIGDETDIATVRHASFASDVTVFDSLGNDHLVKMRFTRLAPVPVVTEIDPFTGEEITTGGQNQWGWSTVVGKNDNANGVFDEVQGNGVMTFTSDGFLDPLNPITSLLPTDGFDFEGRATADQKIAFNFEGTRGNGRDAATQFGTPSPSALLQQTQDGFSAGTLQGFSVDSDGIINGLFTNGTTQALAQVLLATFTNEDALVRVGANNYIQTRESGEPLIAAPQTAGRGSIRAKALESSTVDLTKQFVKLITYQRGFQANSRVITTSDEVLQEVINLKR
jgi:flagellar hook-basal body protein